MGITENYRFTKCDCRVCDDEGMIDVPEDMDPLNFCMSPGMKIPEGTLTKRVVCPICDGRGWYYLEEED